MGAYGALWGSMGAYGGLWGSIGAYGDLWGPMGTFGGLWGPLGAYRGLWGPLTEGVPSNIWGVYSPQIFDGTPSVKYLGAVDPPNI